MVKKKSIQVDEEKNKKYKINKKKIQKVTFENVKH